MINFISNIPIYIGLIFKAISNMLFTLSFKLHILFKTEAGIKLKEIESVLFTKKKGKEIKVKPQFVPNTKLVNILKEKDDDKPVYSNVSRRSKFDN